MDTALTDIGAFSEVQSQARATLKHVKRARYATRIAGPHLNSNFDRDFLPTVSALEEQLRKAITHLNSGFLENVSDDHAASLATTIRLDCKLIREVLAGCHVLGLHRNPLYAAILASIEHNRDHLLAIAEGIEFTNNPDLVQVVHDAVVELL